MKRFKLFFLTLVFASGAVRPLKEASAGIIVQNQAGAVGMFFGYAGAIVGASLTSGDARKAFTGIAIGLLLLSGKADQIEDKLVNLIPEAPNFIHAQIAEEFEAAAKNVAPNAKGLKSVVLDSKTTASIMEEIFYLDLETQKEINHIMTVKIDL